MLAYSCRHRQAGVPIARGEQLVDGRLANIALWVRNVQVCVQELVNVGNQMMCSEAIIGMDTGVRYAHAGRVNRRCCFLERSLLAYHCKKRAAGSDILLDVLCRLMPIQTWP